MGASVAVASDVPGRDGFQHHGFPVWGVKLSFYKDFIAQCGGEEALRGLTTLQVCNKFVKPATLSAKVSYCEHLIAAHSSAVGRATVFISHAWSFFFLDVVDALTHHFRDNLQVTIWFDLFSNNQHGTSINSFEWWSTTFKTAIAHFGRTVMVFAPWNNPVPLTRAWCLWELLCTIETKSQFEVALSVSEERRFFDDIASAGASVSINAMFGAVDCEKSESSVASDKDQIFEVVRRSTGFSAVNAMIFTRMREWVVSVASAAVVAETRPARRQHLLTSLAGIYDSLGRFALAEPLFAEALALSVAAHGPAHHATLDAMNNSAAIYGKLGRLREAEQIYERCLPLMRSSLGEAHPDTLCCMNNLAALYDAANRYAEAEPLYHQCLQARKQTLGAEHPDVLNSMNNLAVLYGAIERLDEAAALLGDCLAASRRVLGDGHPNTVATLNNLATVLDSLGNWPEAERLYVECLARRQASLGEDHPSNLGTMANLAGLYFNQGRVDEAAAMFARCLRGMRAELGDGHPSTLSVLSSVAAVHCARREFGEAQRVYEECVAQMTATEHPDLAALVDNLNLFYASHGIDKRA